ncbi:MAG: hypothetical protein K8L91_24390 [Anaerolineae bacterium]|nr:hypothetical protein [Anaerolineae bacterium]
MKKLLISLLTLLIVAVIALPAPTAHAQLGNLLGNTFIFEDGTTIQYPSDWRAFVRPSGYTFIASEQTQILFALDPATIFADYDVPEGDLAAYLADSFGTLTDTEILDPATIIPVTLGSLAAVQSVTTTADEFGGIEHWVFVTQLNNGIVMYISVINLTGDVIAEPDDVMSILNSLDDSKSTYIPGALDFSRLELEQTYTLLSGAVISYPAGWEIESFTDPEADYELNIFSDLTSLVVDSLGTTAFAEAGVAEGDLGAILGEAFLPLSDTITFDPALVRPFHFDDYDGARYDYTDVDSAGVPFQRSIIVTQLSNGEVFYLAVVPQTDATIIEMPIALQIIASLTAPEDVPLFGDDVSGTAGNNTFTFDDGAIMTWDPALWTFTSDDKYQYLDSALTSIRFEKYTNTIYADNGLQIGDNAALMALLFYSNDTSIVFDPANYQDITLGSFAGGRYDFVDRLEDGTEYEHAFVIVQLQDNSVVLLSVIPWTDFAITEMDAVLAVASSFTFSK